MSIEKKKARYLRAREAYYNGDPIMDDAAFDQLEDQIKALDPKWKELRKTGVKVKHKKAEVPLEKFMPSLSKVYPEQASKWLAKHGEKYIVMDKLDGGSLQLTVKKGKPVRLVTRGDGITGGDISFLLPQLLPAELKIPISGVFRCEAVMPTKVFTKKYAAEFENPRNLVNGALNRSMEVGAAADPVLADTHVVVLGMYGSLLTAGLARARQAGLRVVGHAFCKVTGPELLAQRLELRRNEGDYEIDGLVIAPESFVMDYKSADKPKGITAFKINDEENATEAVVESIIWQVTGHGRIIPKIKIKPVRLDGVNVEHATVHNAKWMMDRKIGPGARIKILRSGGVIPKIVGVVKAGKFQPPEIDYMQKGVHFVVRNSDEDTDKRIKVLRIHKFMTTLGIELLAQKTITQCLEELPQILTYVSAWKQGSLKQHLLDSEIGPKQTDKIVAEFDRVLSQTVTMSQLMVALSIFAPGVGERRLSMLEAAGISMNDLLDMDSASRVQRISEVHGFSDKTAKLVSEGISKFAARLAKYRRHLKLDGKLPRTKKTVKGPLTGQVFTFTGYRSPEQEAAITAAGGTIASFSKKTTTLLVTSGGKTSTKAEKAKAMGIKVASFSTLGI